MTVSIDVLDNGLRVVTERMPDIGSTAIGVWIEAGGRHERALENGVAHFLEHMAFKGTATRTARQIAEEIEDVGGYLNAYTSRENTAYYARVLAEDAPLALDVIADILLNPSFEEDEIAIERGVILQEIGQSHDTPDDVIFDWLQEAAYPDQPMGRAILGAPERVRAFSRADLQGFVERQYSPDRMIVAAAGAVDHDAVVRQAQALFGAIPARPRPATDPARFTGGEFRRVKKLEQAHFTLAFEGPNYRETDLYAGQVFSTLFGGGMSSRLFQEARETRGLCYTIFSQASSYEDTGLFTIYAGTGASEVRGLAELVADELRRAAESVSDAEVARARAQIKASLVMGIESPFGRAERLARSLAIWGRVPPIEETIAHVEAVGPAEARAVAERMAASGRLALAMYGPVASAPDAATLSARIAA